MSEAELVKALLADSHNTIHQYCEDAANSINEGRLDPVYPPGVVVEQVHLDALASIKLDGDQLEAMKILLKDLCASALFDLFSKMDGVAEPENVQPDNLWEGLRLKKPIEGGDEELLHDEFMASYWEFHESST